MNTCKTCRHWMPCSDIATHNRQSEKRKSGGICQSEKLNEDAEYGPDNLTYSYSEGGRFWTGPEFGCVHHAQWGDG